MQSLNENQIYSRLNTSKDATVKEALWLKLLQKIAEIKTELDFFEKKYKMTFKQFSRDFMRKKADFERESNWLAWKYAYESLIYWNKVLKKK